jgi:hypothetical protein
MGERSTDSQKFGRDWFVHNSGIKDNLNYTLLVLVLLALSAIFLYLEHLTHQEFLFHLAAIPLEILLGAILVERYLVRTEKTKRARQLMFIKSCLFRSDMRNVFLTNFTALEEPKISMSSIRKASLPELEKLRKCAESLEYRSPEAMDLVIMEYVSAYPVFHRFMEWSLENDFEHIFEDMIFIMHFIQDVQLYKRLNPSYLFILYAKNNPAVMAKVNKVLGDGIVKFLDYAIELKKKQPNVFEQLLSDYEISQLELNIGRRVPSVVAGRASNGAADIPPFPIP